MSKNNEISTIEHAKGGSGGFKRHCARRWWIYLIAFVVIALAMVLGLIFGVLPKVAQKAINDSVVTVQGVSITKPENDRFVYAQNSTVNGHVPTKAHLNPQRLAMSLPDGKPFMYLNVSRIDLKDEFHIDVTDYPMEIADKDAFNEFTNMVLGQAEVPLALTSRPEIVAGSLHNYVNYNKRVTLKGFNGLSGITLYNAKVLEKAEADGTNMLSDLYIPNKSDFILEVGNMTCNFAAPGLGDLGFGVIENLLLNRGDNYVQVRAHLKPEVYSNKAIVTFIPIGGINVTVTGNSTIFNGQHISWLETPLNALPLQVPLLKAGSQPPSGA